MVYNEVRNEGLQKGKVTLWYSDRLRTSMANAGAKKGTYGFMPVSCKTVAIASIEGFTTALSSPSGVEGDRMKISIEAIISGLLTAFSFGILQLIVLWFCSGPNTSYIGCGKQIFTFTPGVSLNQPMWWTRILFKMHRIQCKYCTRLADYYCDDDPCCSGCWWSFHLES